MTQPLTFLLIERRRQLRRRALEVAGSAACALVVALLAASARDRCITTAWEGTTDDLD